MTGDQLQQALTVGLRLVKQAGRKLKPYYGQVEYRTKGESHELVTELDLKTEKFLAKGLAKFDASIGFKGEEYGVHARAKRFWLSDPIDGTLHFIRGLPFCTTMLALIDGQEVVLGIIHDFIRDESYWALKGQGAFKDGQPISVSNHCFKTGVIITLETRQTDFYLESRHHLRQIKNSRILITHNAGFEMAMVARGSLDGRITYQGFGQDYDYAAGSLIIREADGVVRNIGSNSYDYRNYNFVAASPATYQDLTLGKQAIFPLRANDEPHFLKYSPRQSS